MAFFDRLRKKTTAKPASKKSAEGNTIGLDEPQAEDADGLAAESRTASDQSPPAKSAQTEKEKRGGGVLARFRQGLKKTTQVLNTDVRDLFKKEGELMDDEFINKLRALMIRTDMGAKPAREICDDVAEKFRGRVVHMEDVLASVRGKLNELTAQPEHPIAFAESGPTVIMVVGVNGSGKTTSIAKLTRLFIDQGKSVVLGAGDTFRAAAVEQLTIWSQRLGGNCHGRPWQRSCQRWAQSSSSGPGNECRCLHCRYRGPTADAE